MSDQPSLADHLEELINMEDPCDADPDEPISISIPEAQKIVRALRIAEVVKKPTENEAAALSSVAKSVKTRSAYAHEPGYIIIDQSAADDAAITFCAAIIDLAAKRGASA